MDSAQHWVIKNSEGELLKYLYANKAVFTKKTDRAFRVYTFAKQSTVDKTLEKLKEFGWLGCEAVVVDNEDEHEEYNSIQQRKDEEDSQKQIDFENALKNADELTEGYHKYCRVCTRACKQNEKYTVFFGKCPQFDFGNAV